MTGAGSSVPEPFGRLLSPTGKEKPTMTNEGTADRVIRVVLGLALLSITMVGPSPTIHVLVPSSVYTLGFDASTRMTRSTASPAP